LARARIFLEYFCNFQNTFIDLRRAGMHLIPLTWTGSESPVQFSPTCATLIPKSIIVTPGVELDFATCPALECSIVDSSLALWQHLLRYPKGFPAWLFQHFPVRSGNWTRTYCRPTWSGVFPFPRLPAHFISFHFLPFAIFHFGWAASAHFIDFECNIFSLRDDGSGVLDGKYSFMGPGPFSLLFSVSDPLRSVPAIC